MIQILRCEERTYALDIYIYMYTTISYLPVANKDCITKRLYSDSKQPFSESKWIVVFLHFLWPLLKVCFFIRSSLTSLVHNPFFRSLVDNLFWIQCYVFVMYCNHVGFFVYWYEFHSLRSFGITFNKLAMTFFFYSEKVGAVCSFL